METLLAIETSCDETAVAIVRGDKTIASHIVLSQLEEHAPYGGVVPEIAARAHMEHLDRLIHQALTEAKLSFDDMDAIAATAGPGLIGGVMVGVMTAKAICSVTGKPFIAVNHLEGHALTARLTNDVPFPYLLLLVSGGHCQLLIVEGVGKYTRLGSTLDDAVGEAFDKVAKMLGLGYPGGPIVERYAENGNAKRFPLPQPLKGTPGCNFSFSGLKTAVRRTIDSLPHITPEDIADICASFQFTVGEILSDRVSQAMTSFKQAHPDATHFVTGGGVAANRYLKAQLQHVAADYGLEFIAPPIPLCTDNAAMIAWAGIERFRLNLTDNLNFAPRARWPLEELRG